MGLLRMLKYVLGTEDETQQPRQTQSSAKNANNAKPARTGQTKQTGQLARRVTQPQLQPLPRRNVNRNAVNRSNTNRNGLQSSPRNRCCQPTASTKRVTSSAISKSTN